MSVFKRLTKNLRLRHPIRVHGPRDPAFLYMCIVSLLSASSLPHCLVRSGLRSRVSATGSLPEPGLGWGPDIPSDLPVSSDVGAVDLNSGPRACAADTRPTQPSLQLSSANSGRPPSLPFQGQLSTIPLFYQPQKLLGPGGTLAVRISLQISSPRTPPVTHSYPVALPRCE